MFSKKIGALVAACACVCGVAVNADEAAVQVEQNAAVSQTEAAAPAAHHEQTVQQNSSKKGKNAAAAEKSAEAAQSEKARK